MSQSKSYGPIKNYTSIPSFWVRSGVPEGAPMDRARRDWWLEHLMI